MAVRGVGRSQDVPLDFLRAEPTLPADLPVLDDDSGHPGDVGLLPQRFDVAFEQGIEQGLPRPWRSQGKGDTSGDGDHAEAVGHGPDAEIIALRLGRSPNRPFPEVNHQVSAASPV